MKTFETIDATEKWILVKGWLKGLAVVTFTYVVLTITFRMSGPYELVPHAHQIVFAGIMTFSTVLAQGRLNLLQSRLKNFEIQDS